MLNSLTHIAAFETVLIKFTLKQKQFIYQIARLEYRIYKSLTILSEVNALIVEEEKNLKSLNAAIKAAGEGKVAEKLTIWKTKAGYKLFKLNLRKNKIDITKVVLNQSKLEQLKQALIALENDIKAIEDQKPNVVPSLITDKKEVEKIDASTTLESVNKFIQKSSITHSLELNIEDKLKMAS